MKKICSRSCIILGSLLLIMALALVLYNVNQDKKSGKAAEAVLTELKEKIVPAEQSETKKNESSIPQSGDLFAEYSAEPAAETSENLIEIDGNNYIGYISIPSIQIELPVMSEWSYDNLKVSPCRYKGSADKNNLIIAAHNYSSHFGRIQNLNSGDIIMFTSANGKVYTYETVQTEFINGYDISAMENNSDDWDLTLFTCTLSGQSRVTVRGVRSNY